MSNEEEKLNQVVEALEQEGINAKDSIKDINIGNKVAKVLNTVWGHSRKSTKLARY